MRRLLCRQEIFRLLVISILFIQPCYSQNTNNLINKNLKNKFSFKAGIASDYDLYPKWGHQYSVGYERNIWKNLSFNFSYIHCQTNTLKGTFKYDTFLSTNTDFKRNYINNYIGISSGDMFNNVGENGINVHDAFRLNAKYEFKLGKHLFITPFLGVAYGWSSFTRVFIQSANFKDDKLINGTVGFSYEQGKVYGPDMGFDFGYTFKNKHHQIFFEPELILLVTPGTTPLIVSAYEAIQFSLGYNYRF